MVAGSWSLALTGMRTLISRVSAFQSRVGAATAATAADAERSVHFGAAVLDRLGREMRPLAVVSHGGAGSILLGEGDEMTLGRSGQIVTTFVDNAAYSDDSRAYEDFAKWTGLLHDGIDDLSGKLLNVDEVAFESAEVVLAPVRTELRSRPGDDAMWAALAWYLQA